MVFTYHAHQVFAASLHPYDVHENPTNTLSSRSRPNTNRPPSQPRFAHPHLPRRSSIHDSRTWLSHQFKHFITYRRLLGVSPLATQKGNSALSCRPAASHMPHPHIPEVREVPESPSPPHRRISISPSSFNKRQLKKRGE
jgi:hypothetical protein